ncbi:MAG: branched-chain amino acid ABC transporter permease [Candidatus Nephthysia bennettiae]|nr:MAG: branched-chain amino acid ABC transporter permease [Candidatus Dormibacteraeota bacterium]
MRLSGLFAAGRLPISAIVLAVLGLVVVLGIPMVTDSFQTFQFANVAVFLVAIIGVNLLTGYSGQISLGNGAFMAIGGYTTALMVSRLGVPYGLTIPAGALLAAAAGVLIGIPALRLRGIYLALATFALALSVTPVLNNFDNFTGGHSGINLKPAAPPFGLDLSNEQWLYFLCWGVAAILFVPARLLVRSRTGRAWMAIRDSETAATANGVSVAFYKTLAFAISAFYAGVAGSLQAIVLAYINPDSYSLALSLSLLIGAVAGGLANIWGPVLGGLVVVWLPYLAERASGLHVGPVSFGGKPDIGFGVLLLVLMFFAPAGLGGLIGRGIRRYQVMRQAEPDRLGT